MAATSPSSPRCLNERRPIWEISSCWTLAWRSFAAAGGQQRKNMERDGEQTRGTLPKTQLKEEEEEEECAGESGGNSEEKKWVRGRKGIVTVLWLELSSEFKLSVCNMFTLCVFQRKVECIASVYTQASLFLFNLYSYMYHKYISISLNVKATFSQGAAWWEFFRRQNSIWIFFTQKTFQKFFFRLAKTKMFFKLLL